MTEAGRTGRMKALRRLLGVVVAIVVLQYAVGAVVFLAHADSDLPARSDAVVVLAGSVSRLPVARELMDGGIAPVLLVSDDSPSEDAERGAFCAAPRERYTVICRRAVPFSTRGEARMTAELATTRRWRSIVVVTSRYHLLRTRILFRRCTDATLVLRGAREPWPGLLLAIPLEWVKLAVAETVRRAC